MKCFLIWKGGLTYIPPELIGIYLDEKLAKKHCKKYNRRKDYYEYYIVSKKIVDK